MVFVQGEFITTRFLIDFSNKMPNNSLDLHISFHEIKLELSLMFNITLCRSGVFLLILVCHRRL